MTVEDGWEISQGPAEEARPWRRVFIADDGRGRKLYDSDEEALLRRVSEPQRR